MAGLPDRPARGAGAQRAAVVGPLVAPDRVGGPLAIRKRKAPARIGARATAAPGDTGRGLRVDRLRVLRGPNIWRSTAAIVCEVEAATRLPPAPGGDAAFVARFERVAAALLGTGVAGHDKRPLRIDGDASWATLLGDLALLLQRLAGDAVTWRLVDAAPGEAHSTLVVDFEEERVGLAAVEDAHDILRACLDGEAINAGRIVAGLRDLRARAALDPTTALLVTEARRRGIPVRRDSRERGVQLGLGRHLCRIDGTMTDRTTGVAVGIAADWPRAQRLLRRVGLPVSEDGSEPHPDRRRAFHVTVVAGRVIAVVERTTVEIGGMADGTIVDRMGEIHPRNVSVCAYAADVIGLATAGIDVRSDDIAVPFDRNGATMVAIDGAAPILPAVSGPVGARAIAGAILDSLYPPGSTARIPIIAITGTNGKTTTTRLIAHLFRNAGSVVGFTTTDGVYVQNDLLVEGDMTGPMSADIVFSHPRVEIAVLETARGGILRAGLGFDECDVGVVLNVTSDHLGLRGVHTLEQLAEAKSVIVRAVKAGGVVVLNADDPLVARMRAREQAVTALFSIRAADDDPGLSAHIRSGALAMSVESDVLTVHRAGRPEAVIPVADIPLTMGGAARFQVANAAAAALAAHAQGLPLADVRRGLASFHASSATTPGRMNVLPMPWGTIILDYAHNPAAIAALLDYAHRVPATRRIGVFVMPGDRRDDDIREIGRLATGTDIAIFKEHPHYRRGREPGAIAALMREGYLAAGGTADRCVEALDELAAVAAVLGNAQNGDLVLYVADDLELALRTFEAAGGGDAPRARAT